MSTKKKNKKWGIKEGMEHLIKRKKQLEEDEKNPLFAKFAKERKAKVDKEMEFLTGLQQQANGDYGNNMAKNGARFSKYFNGGGVKKYPHGGPDYEHAQVYSPEYQEQMRIEGISPSEPLVSSYYTDFDLSRPQSSASAQPSPQTQRKLTPAEVKAMLAYDQSFPAQDEEPEIRDAWEDSPELDTPENRAAYKRSQDYDKQVAEEGFWSTPGNTYNPDTGKWEDQGIETGDPFADNGGKKRMGGGMDPDYLSQIGKQLAYQDSRRKIKDLAEKKLVSDLQVNQRGDEAEAGMNYAAALGLKSEDIDLRDYYGTALQDYKQAKRDILDASGGNLADYLDVSKRARRQMNDTFMKGASAEARHRRGDRDRKMNILSKLADWKYRRGDTEGKYAKDLSIEDVRAEGNRDAALAQIYGADYDQALAMHEDYYKLKDRKTQEGTLASAYPDTYGDSFYKWFRR
jgi:hypothetical protein